MSRSLVRIASVVSLWGVALLQAGEFDGGLPATPSESVDPLGPFPPHAEAFLSDRAQDMIVYWDAVLETPRYLRPLEGAPIAITGGGSGGVTKTPLGEAVRAFIDSHAKFFGVSGDELGEPAVEALGELRLVLFRQQLRGIPIRGASIRVLVRTDGTLQSVTSYVLREKPTLAATVGDPTELARRLQEERGYEVLQFESQFIFRSVDPKSAEPFWRFIVSAEGDGAPGEIFASIDGTQLLDERRYFFELGVVRGRVRAFYPNPDENHPDFFRFSFADLDGGPFPVEPLVV